MNTTNNFFATKAEYIAFRKAFAAAQNDPRAKKSFVGTGAHKMKQPGWFSSEYFLLFNLISGRPFYTGFTPKRKVTYLESGGDPDRAISDTLYSLKTVVGCAKRLLDPSSIHVPSYLGKRKQEFINQSIALAQDRVNKFLEPLGGCISLAQLANLQLPFTPTTDGKKTYAELITDIEDAVVPQTPTPAAPVAGADAIKTESKEGGLLAKVRGAVGI